MQLDYHPLRVEGIYGMLIGIVLSLFTAMPVRPVGADSTLDSWFWRNPLPQGSSLADIEYEKNEFLSVGSAGVIHSSLEGLKDTGVSLENLHGIAFGDNTIVAVGEYGTILTSTDGDNWILRAGPDGMFKLDRYLRDDN